jgi:glycosyltransferase involved in cell wall biosynthesis
VLISILIPTYNRLNYLKEAVNSCLGQSYKNIEIVIVQDPMPDGINKEIFQWGMKVSSLNPIVKFYINEVNLGLAGNWNACISKASGDFVLIIGDDDRLLSGCLEKLFQGCVKGADVSFSNHYLIDEKGIQIKSTEDHTKKYKRNKLEKGFLKNPEEIIWGNAIPISSALIRKKYIQDLKFRNELNTPEIDLFLRMNQAGCQFYFTPEYLTEYRIHPNSATAKGLKIHRVFDVLETMPVTQENFKYKFKLMNSLAFVSVNKFLAEGNKKKASHIFWGSYYGFWKRFHPRGIAQLILIALPSILCQKVLYIYYNRIA